MSAKKHKKDGKDEKGTTINEKVNDPTKYSGNRKNDPLKEHSDENARGLSRSLNEQIGGTDDRVV
ncbi:MAG TPA: hypothetical protein VNS32_07805 [Flavisolibacter sp.]|nr:hypothetical protein [Flavisolibacter sp.]